ncbi:hypothetical protein Pmani_032014 [Petrolisthes manimaculis]|uniref:Uncharacterized protein n=1 Tax=Petrolisthes manimaculis TaxID=1843537 RepID=A0AAE1NSK5_9EUCA|nr:hypothetical protein Pmani_032014 [Petrolisthes manimaculis]
MWNTLKPDQTRPSKKEESVWGVTTQLVLLLQVPCCPHQTPEALQEAGDSSRCNHDYNEAGTDDERMKNTAFDQRPR